MTIPQNTAGATTTAKISDLNALIIAINAELDLLATKATVTTNTAALTALTARVAALEAKVIPPDLTTRVKALEDKPAPVIPDITPLATKAELTPFRDFDLALEQRLTERIAALEALIVRSPVESPTPIPAAYEPLDKPAGIDPATPHLVYDKATIYLGDMEIHALRINATKWRLFARLNYIVIASADWTYDEIVEGTAEQVYAHALSRLRELAALKPKHDAVHHRVVEMSEGKP